MELQSITQEIHSASQRLAKGAELLFPLARAMAEAEAKYRKALAIEEMRLREEKVSVTLIPDIARGNCADAKFERDLAEYKLQAARESLRAIETQISGLQTIIKYQIEV